ncbi:MAG TPA: aminoglycoside phosphotransferase family protein [Actinomycetota bacterium]|nr:aminoglycoside phosphotransferase family protein [Actinomycetota bacterium]
MDRGPGDAANDIDAAVQTWLASLSGLIAELTERWELELEDPLPSGSLGYVVGATRAGSRPVVLELTYPDGWFPERVVAFLAWDGDGAVELIDHDPRGAMLLERAVPGTPLADEPEERALSLARDVARRLWIPAPEGITAATDEAGRWVASFRDRNEALGRPLPDGLADDATASMRELEASPDEPVLLHGDLRLGNVVAAEREPWLAVSPHPLVGDRAFDVGALLLDLPDPVDGPTLHRRFGLLAELFAIDRERFRAWSITVALDAALASWEGGEVADARRQLAIAEGVREGRA